VAWITQAYEGAVHVVPDHDSPLVTHVLEPSCWCGPKEEEPGMWVHRDELDRTVAATT
jgi:hypothetical protein